MNMSIKCQVSECKYNDGNEHYCTLNKIEVIKNSTDATSGITCTDCGNFEVK